MLKKFGVLSCGLLAVLGTGAAGEKVARAQGRAGVGMEAGEAASPADPPRAR